jgi:hypothetical protein
MAPTPRDPLLVRLDESLSLKIGNLLRASLPLSSWCGASMRAGDLVGPRHKHVRAVPVR